MTMTTVTAAGITTMTDSAREARLSAWGMSVVIILACGLAVSHTEARRALVAIDAEVAVVIPQQLSPPMAGLVRAAPPRQRVVVVRRSRAS